MQKIIGGGLLAVTLAALASGATIAGIDVWKIALAAAGAAIFVMGGRSRARR